jgi:hypothetical protein
MFHLNSRKPFPSRSAGRLIRTYALVIALTAAAAVVIGLMSAP